MFQLFAVLFDNCNCFCNFTRDHTRGLVSSQSKSEKNTRPVNIEISVKSKHSHENNLLLHVIYLQPANRKIITKYDENNQHL